MASMYHLLPDNELLTLLQNNDEAAFTEIYNRYWEVLYQHTYNYTKDVQGTEDILHDIFARLWNNRQKAAIQMLKSYLYSSVKYGILSAMRRAALQGAYEKAMVDRLLPPADEQALPDDADREELLNMHIKALPERCRLIFRYKQQGLSNSEIATEMNISVSTVKNQVNTGLKQLRLSLKDFFSFLFSFL